MKKISLIIGLVVVAVGLYFVSTSSNNGSVELSVLSGSVSYRERIALPEGSVIEVALQDISKADVAATVIASSTIVTTGENVPVPFELSYDSSLIAASSTYSVSARIIVDGELRWANQVSVPVLTNGAATSSVEVVVSATGGSSVSGSTQGIPDTSKAVTLEGTTFRLSSFKGTALPVGQDYFLKFDGGRLSVKFCNNVSGGYKVDEKGIIKGNLISTQMYCGEPENLMAIESTFGLIVGNGAAHAINGNILTLMGSKGDVLVFEAVSE